MSTRYPGGFINRSAPVVVGPTEGEGGSAPGVWTLEQAGYYKKQGIWPTPFSVGTIFSWGSNNRGQLGQNNIINRSSPVQLGIDTNWSKIACGGEHNAAIKSTGELFLIGYNVYGQLGQGNNVYRSSPVQVGALTSWFSVACGLQHTMATKTDNTLWAWGRGSTYGALGLNSASNFTSPRQVGALTNWSLISCGFNFTSSIKTDGTLWIWGDNANGQLGQNNIANYSSPVQVGALTDWKSISCGSFHTAAIKNNGSLWTCGSNTYGQLGQNISYSVNRSSPVQVGQATEWATAVCGSSHTIAIKTNGTIWSFGDGSLGQLGTGNRTSTSSPVQVGALTTWLKLSTTSYSSIAIKNDGTLWTWGWGSSGRLGLNDIISRSSPVQIGNLATWKSISKGSAANAVQMISS